MSHIKLKENQHVTFSLLSLSSMWHVDFEKCVAVLNLKVKNPLLGPLRTTVLFPNLMDSLSRDDTARACKPETDPTPLLKTQPISWIIQQ